MRLALPDPDEVHLWHGRLDVTRREAEALLALLPTEERADAGPVGPSRASAASASPASLGRLVSRALLRRLLAAYAGTAAGDLRIRRSRTGKPALVGWPGPRAPRFSLARSGQRVLVAVSAAGPVGVDLELLRPLPRGPLERAALRPAERRALQRLPAEERDRAFLRLWTAREAIAKARPRARLLDPRRIPLEPAPGGGLRPPGPRGGRTGGGWSLLMLEPEAGYLAAVAAPRAGFLPRLRTLP